MNGAGTLVLLLSLLAAPHGWLGVMVAPQQQPGGSASGLLVVDLVPGGPAAAGGVRPGDLLVSVGGAPVGDLLALSRALGAAPPGRSTPVVVLREGKQLSLPVLLGTPPEGTQAKEPDLSMLPSRLEKLRRGYLGVEVLALSPGLREYFGIPEGGLLVTQVAAGSPAGRAGVRSGDVITQVNGAAVAEPVQLQAAVRDLRKGQIVALDLVRKGERSRKEVPVEEREAEAFYMVEKGAEPRAVYLEELRRQVSDPAKRAALEEALRKRLQAQREIQDAAARQAAASRAEAVAALPAAGLADLEKRLEARIRDLEKRVRELEEQNRRLEEKLRADSPAR